tara:strand:+ start:1569 stop:2591 length:1023 start_codon:yes stop_codon:yes gene_type:complete
MNLKYKLKIKAYRFFHSKLGKKILKTLSGYVYVNNIKNTGKNNHPFIISITIDTESGYITNKDHRIWQKQNPKAYIGFYKGIENWRNLFNKYNVKATFFLSTNCFSAPKTEYDKIIQQLKLLIKEGHEIGLHVHPDSDLALQKLTKKEYPATSAIFYSKSEINEIISKSKKLIKDHLGINITSFRWGNWALNTDSVSILEKNNIKIDSSSSPEIKGHINNEMAYDWSKTKRHYPWLLSKTNYQNTNHQNSKVLEIPIATFKFFNFTLRADPANSHLLISCFDQYYLNTNRSKKPFKFVVISHSSEATHKDGTTTNIIKSTEEFIKHAKNFNNVSFNKLNN